jgi:hypothetical protein
MARFSLSFPVLLSSASLHPEFQIDANIMNEPRYDPGPPSRTTTPAVPSSSLLFCRSGWTALHGVPDSSFKLVQISHLCPDGRRSNYSRTMIHSPSRFVLSSSIHMKFLFWFPYGDAYEFRPLRFFMNKHVFVFEPELSLGEGIVPEQMPDFNLVCIRDGLYWLYLHVWLHQSREHVLCPCLRCTLWI